MKSGSSNVSTTYLAGIRSREEFKTSRLGPSRDHATVVCETFHTVSKRLYEKASSTSQTPQHEATHRSIYKRLAARTPPLVIFAHPAVVANPGKGAFHYPPTWQDPKSSRGHKLLPIDCLAFLGQFLRPVHQHCFGGRFARTFDQFHTPSQSLLHPILAFVLSSVAGVQPQMRKAQELLLSSLK